MRALTVSVLLTPRHRRTMLTRPPGALAVGGIRVVMRLELAPVNGARFLLASTTELHGDPQGAPADREVLGPRRSHRAAEACTTNRKICRSTLFCCPEVAVQRLANDPGRRRSDISIAKRQLEWQPTLVLLSSTRCRIE
jgi:hypothetical protein